MRHESGQENGKSYKVKYGAHIITNTDFGTAFDGRFWTVEWKKDPPTLPDAVDCYQQPLKGDARREFERAVER